MRCSFVLQFVRTVYSFKNGRNFDTLTNDLKTEAASPSTIYVLFIYLFENLSYDALGCQTKMREWGDEVDNLRLTGWSCFDPSTGKTSPPRTRSIYNPHNSKLHRPRNSSPILYTVPAQCYFQLSPVGDFPLPQNPKFPQKNTQNTKKNIKNGSNLLPRYVSPRTWSLELTLVPATTKASYS